jgi:hypothetical protein
MFIQIKGSGVVILYLVNDCHAADLPAYAQLG